MNTGREIEILMVEDNEADAVLTEEALRDAKLHNRLHIVRDGEEAMDYLQRRPPWEAAPRPDLILLDLNLPRKDGREVLQEIKSDAKLKRIPVVILTSSETEEDILRAYNLSANCYVSKPVDLEQFVRVVQSIEDFWLKIVRLPHGEA